MIMLDEMIPVAEILANYPEGTQLKVWFKYACAGQAPQYAGLFVVGGKVLRESESGRMWSVDEVNGIDRRRPVYIVRVETVERGQAEGVDSGLFPGAHPKGGPGENIPPTTG